MRPRTRYALMLCEAAAILLELISQSQKRSTSALLPSPAPAPPRTRREATSQQWHSTPAIYQAHNQQPQRELCPENCSGVCLCVGGPSADGEVGLKHRPPVDNDLPVRLRKTSAGPPKPTAAGQCYFE